jgi:hypothetical protein
MSRPAMDKEWSRANNHLDFNKQNLYEKKMKNMNDEFQGTLKMISDCTDRSKYRRGRANDKKS